MDLSLKAARVHVQGRVLYNQTYCKLSSSSLRTPHCQNIFLGVSPSDPPFFFRPCAPLFTKSVSAPVHWPSTMYIALLVLAFVAPLFVEFTISLLKKDYRDTIKYCDYCLSHYCDSRKALSLSPNLVQHSEVKESIVTVCNIRHLTKQHEEHGTSV